MSKNVKIGTCSWNYPSWQGLVYTRPCKTAAEYLVEYSRHFRTAEIDSWFYRVPPRAEVMSYRDAVDADFRFTCKVPQEITLTHQQGTSGNGSLLPNTHFLSPERFKAFIDCIIGTAGIASKKKGSRYAQTDSVITTGDDVRSMAAAKFHLDNLQLAQQAIRAIAQKDRNISSLVGSLSPECYAQVQEEMRQLRRKILTIMSHDTSKEKNVYQILQMTPVIRSIRRVLNHT